MAAVKRDFAKFFRETRTKCSIRRETWFFITSLIFDNRTVDPRCDNVIGLVVVTIG